MNFNGLNMSLGNLSKLSDAKTFSISPENPTGEKGKAAMAEADPNGAARDLGKGYKCRPTQKTEAGKISVIADIEGPGAIQSIWMTGRVSRDIIIRFYWDNQENPSIECPLPDFFGMPFSMEKYKNAKNKDPFQPLNSLPICVNPNRGLNCFWEMPFKKHCKITLENLHPTDDCNHYFQINYTLTEVPEDIAYFHAQFRRRNPLGYKEDYVILDGIEGRGHYVGTSLGVALNNNGWWGEGEVKFYLDGDCEYPSICSTGTEDYFLGAFNWDVNEKYTTYSTPFAGMYQSIAPDGLYVAQMRQAMYRWHIMDPIRFNKDIKVIIQLLGWRSEGRYYPGMHDVCSTAYWYQTLPTPKFPELPGRDELENV